MTAQHTRAAPGQPMPAITVPLLGGATVSTADGEGWRMLIVYRGRHCPRCKRYLAKLEAMLPDFQETGVDILVTSADPADKAMSDRDEFGWTFPLGHSLSLEDMATLGLYASDPASAAETDRPYAEPGLFAVNPDGLLHVVGISNAASCRPDLDVVLDGIKGIQTRGLPIRGTRALAS
ncbi:MAG: redoxin domain-containing protein [Pseudomonadota bacterium]